MLWAAAVTHPFKLVLAINFHVANHHGQHLLMDVNSRYSVRHKVSSWRERRACCEFLNQGHRLSPLPPKGTDNAQLFAQPCTLRIRPADSLNFSSANSTSPLRACPILHLLESIFMRFSGPQAQTDTRENPDIPMMCSSSPT